MGEVAEEKAAAASSKGRRLAGREGGVFDARSGASRVSGAPPRERCVVGVARSGARETCAGATRDVFLSLAKQSLSHFLLT